MPTEKIKKPLSLPGWRRFDRYILGEVMSPFLGGLAFFTFVFLMTQILRLADFFIVHGVPGPILLKMLFLLALSFMPLALPIAFLISILIGFGRLSVDSELVAFKASGISIWRMALPVISLGMVVVFLSLALNVSWVPWGQRQFKSTLVKVGNTKVVSSIKEGTFTTGFFDLLIFADKVDSKTKKMQNVFIFDERQPKNPLTVVASTGELLPVQTQSELGSAALLNLQDGNIHQNNIETQTYQRVDFNQYKLFLEIGEGQDTAVLKPKTQPFSELEKRVRENPPHSQHHIESKTEIWRRLTTALSPMIFVFLGIGFGTVRTRAVRSGAGLIAFLVVLTYWGLQTAVVSLSYTGQFPIIAMMQIPNLVLILAAIFSFRKATW